MAQIDRLGADDRDALDAVLPLQILALMDLSMRVADRRFTMGKALFESPQGSPDLPAEAREAIEGDLAARAGTRGHRGRWTAEAVGRMEIVSGPAVVRAGAESGAAALRRVLKVLQGLA